jgi:hypothetical protein
MRTLPREPWRGGQICGWQIAYGLPWSVFCGEFKKTGSPVCDVHDEELREENGGVLPRFAPGNALGLAAYRITAMPYMFQLAWEPMDRNTPIPATEKEIKAWEESGS